MDIVFGLLGRVVLGGLAIYGLGYLLVGLSFFAFGDDGFSWRGLRDFALVVLGACIFCTAAYFVGNAMLSL